VGYRGNVRYREIARWPVQFSVRIATPDATRIVRRRGARTRVIRTRDRRELTAPGTCEDVACVRGYTFKGSSSEHHEPLRVRPNDCPSRDHGTHMFVIRSVYEPRCLLPLVTAPVTPFCPFLSRNPFAREGRRREIRHGMLDRANSSHVAKAKRSNLRKRK